MGLLDDHRRRLLAGTAFTDPNAAPRTHFGERLQMVHQSCEDQTITFLMQQVALLARRVAVLEGQEALLWGVLKNDL